MHEDLAETFAGRAASAALTCSRYDENDATHKQGYTRHKERYYTLLDVLDELDCVVNPHARAVEAAKNLKFVNNPQGIRLLEWMDPQKTHWDPQTAVEESCWRAKITA